MFLATTAIEEFWDKDEPLLFLGDWCCRYNRRNIWDPLNAIIIQDPWLDRDKYRNAYNYINNLYENTLPRLSKALNSIHGENHNVRYWRIIIGPWLIWYLSALFDRYIRIKDALSNFPNLTTCGLAETSYITPLDTLDFHHHINDDFYNLQICTQLLDCLDIDFERKNTKFNRKIQKDIDRIGNEKNRLLILRRTIIRYILGHLSRFNKRGFPIIIRGGNFTTKQELRLIFQTLGKVQSITNSIASPTDYIVNQAMRKDLKNLFEQRDEFSRILNIVLPTSVPLGFVEGYSDLKEKIMKKFPQVPKVIISAGAFHYDEMFKVWSAECSEEKTELVIMQHGGVYGGGAYLPLEDHDLAISNRFYSWGWNRIDKNNKIYTSPSACPYKREPIIVNNGECVLFVTTVVYRYPYRFRASDQSFREYIAWQYEFFNLVNHQIREKMIVRLHRKEFGCLLGRRLIDKYQDISYEHWEIPFAQRLNQCRLYVFDHNSTTFLESLSANKPSILFCDPTINELHPEASGYYEELRSAGILHDTSESAAAAVNNIYGHVFEWWNNPKTQTARKKFCHNFVRTSTSYIEEWIDEIRCLADGETFVK